MPRLGQAADAAEQQIDTALRSLPQIGEQITEYEAVTAPVASPVRRAVDALGLKAQSAAGDCWFVKYYYPEARRRLSFDAVVEASDKAGRLQVAPACIDAAADTGVIAYEWLGDGWDWARLDALSSPQAQMAQFELRRAIHAGPSYPIERNIFAEIQTFDQATREAGVPRPNDLDWMIDEIAAVAEPLDAACTARKPAHGDGVSSNVMIHTSGALRLVDFDVAGNDDPAHDLASMLVETCPFKEQVSEAVALWSGAPDPELFAKCMLYGIADDLRWGLWGLAMFAESALSGVEFFKYAQWRLLRARANLHDRDFETWCRSFG